MRWCRSAFDSTKRCGAVNRFSSPHAHQFARASGERRFSPVQVGRAAFACSAQRVCRLPCRVEPSGAAAARCVFLGELINRSKSREGRNPGECKGALVWLSKKGERHAE